MLKRLNLLTCSLNSNELWGSVQYKRRTEGCAPGRPSSASRREEEAASGCVFLGGHLIDGPRKPLWPTLLC
ncbi:hypothetical protein NQZ68_019287 [Dissostichus eleginoides]|nr:hypothetical protein NQZ68_019287 [Dissostichus eleginoides]